MALTWRLRLSYVASASVREAKIKHPYMMVFERFCNDFQRLTKIDPLPCITEGINKIVKLAQARQIPCQISTMALLEQAQQMSPERLRTRHILTIAVLRILSENVKELGGLSSLFVQEGERLFLKLTLSAPRVVATRFLNKVAKAVAC
ncbi:hypothetical protein MRX96_056835 [Rhipicephalus microplus]